MLSHNYTIPIRVFGGGGHLCEMVLGKSGDNGKRRGDLNDKLKE